MSKKYSYTMDIYPQQHKEETRLWKFYDNLKKGRFTTTKCTNCGYVMWPPGVVCPECLSDDLQYVDIPKTGRIYAFSIQHAALPSSIEPPVVQAIIDLPNGIRIISPLVGTKLEEVQVGDKVKLKVVDISPDPHGERVLFFFKKT